MQKTIAAVVIATLIVLYLSVYAKDVIISNLADTLYQRIIENPVLEKGGLHGLSN